MEMKRYSELCKLDSFVERFRYLTLVGSVGSETFGSHRFLNQELYQSSEWQRIRNLVIVRDNGCDLAFPGREIRGSITVHHINPVTIDDILARRQTVLDPEFLVCVSNDTHQAIHYGDETKLYPDPIERKPFDTCPWRS